MTKRRISSFWTRRSRAAQSLFECASSRAPSIILAISGLSLTFASKPLGLLNEAVAPDRLAEDPA